MADVSVFFYVCDFSNPNEKLAPWTTRDLGLGSKNRNFLGFFFTEMKKKPARKMPIFILVLKCTGAGFFFRFGSLLPFLLLLGRSIDARLARIACNILFSSSMAGPTAIWLHAELFVGQFLYLDAALVRIFTLEKSLFFKLYKMHCLCGVVRLIGSFEI
jgi:hypothetical protein